MKQYPQIPRNEIITIRDRNKGNADITALLREVRRQHDVIMQIEQLRQSIDRVWKDEVGGNLTALHSLRLLLQNEVGRFSERGRD